VSVRSRVERAIVELATARAELDGAGGAAAVRAYYDLWLALEALARVSAALEALDGDRPLLGGVDRLREERDQ
jgi:hypothetical protein